jgi:nicotinamidase-related amidase
MRHPRLLDNANTLLLVIDMQESFRKIIQDFGNLTRNISILVEASKILNLPVIVSEQYPKGLGGTALDLQSILGTHEKFAKQAFSCCQQENFINYLNSLGRKQVIVTGIETHVCVSQTVHDLLALGFSPHVIFEATTSRSAKNKEIGLEKMASAGAIISSIETALFEMVKDSSSESFKATQQLIKSSFA